MPGCSAAAWPARPSSRRCSLRPGTTRSTWWSWSGSDSIGLQRQLLERGQKRIITLDPGRPQTLVPEGTDPPPVSNFHTLDTLDAAVSLIPWPHPAQARTIAVGSGAPVVMAELVKRIQRSLRTLTEASNELEEAVPFFAQTCVRNLANVADRPSVAALKGALEGVPAVLVSAGPSLDKNIAQLRGLEGRVVIIGINQTVRALRQAGVRADMVIVVDPMKVGYHFEGMAPDEFGTLFLGASVDPSLFSLPVQDIVTFAASPLAESWIYELCGENASSGSGGTVATAALKLAAWLGCTPIISIGRDLALDGKRYYADATADGGEEVEVTDGGQKISFAGYTSKLRLADGGDDTSVRQLLASQVYELHTVPGFFGTPVTTTNLFMYEMDLLRETVQKFAGQAQFINATEGGAFLQGMEHLTLAEALARCPERPVDVGAVVRGRLAGQDLAARRTKLAAGLRTLLRDLDATVALARRATQSAGADRSRVLASAASGCSSARARSWPGPPVPGCSCRCWSSGPPAGSAGNRPASGPRSKRWKTPSSRSTGRSSRPSASSRAVSKTSFPKSPHEKGSPMTRPSASLSLCMIVRNEEELLPRVHLAGSGPLG